MTSLSLLVQVEAIAESADLLDGDEGKPYLGSMAAVIMAYDPPQTQDTGLSLQVRS